MHGINLLLFLQLNSSAITRFSWPLRILHGHRVAQPQEKQEEEEEQEQEEEYPMKLASFYRRVCCRRSSCSEDQIALRRA